MPNFTNRSIVRFERVGILLTQRDDGQRDAGRKLGMHLQKLGHTRVGYVSTFAHPNPYRLDEEEETGSSVVTDRLQAIYESYADAGIQPSTDLIRFTSIEPAAIQQAVAELLGDKFPQTVLITDDEHVGLQTLAVLRKHSIGSRPGRIRCEPTKRGYVPRNAASWRNIHPGRFLNWSPPPQARCLRGILQSSQARSRASTSTAT
jgi:hypothetical protein